MTTTPTWWCWKRPTRTTAASSSVPMRGKATGRWARTAKLGTEDDVKVVGQPWPNNLTTTLADGITISTVNEAETVKVGKRCS
ncbi:MAG: hypothetical protein ACLR23_05480 [Clostridia bacterium]